MLSILSFPLNQLTQIKSQQLFYLFKTLSFLRGFEIFSFHEN